MNCPRCGTGNEKDAYICRSCGYELDLTHLTDEEQKAVDARKKADDAKLTPEQRKARDEVKRGRTVKDTATYSGPERRTRTTRRRTSNTGNPAGADRRTGAADRRTPAQA